MAKRSKQKKGVGQSADALRNNGLQAFRGGDYTRAIEIWERVGRQTPTKLPVAALAEAYFRRGLQELQNRASDADLKTGVQDLRRAVELQPAEARYQLHLGLAAQRQGDLETAIAAYRQARQQAQEFADRAAYPLAVALLQQGADLAADPVWSALTLQERVMLQEASAFRRRPYTLSADAPALWQGLVALDNGNIQEAAMLLRQTLAAPGSTIEAALTHYYLGVIAAQAEDWPAAVAEWRAAAAAGLDSAHGRENLAEALHRLAEEAAQAGDFDHALSVAEETLKYRSTDKALQELLSYLYQQCAYRAAQAGKWDVAQQYWEKANLVDGGSFRLAYNRALAYERAEDFLAAAEAWREALRRRPRRADHPDAISEAQVSRLWRRAAESYVKAGEYEEALQVYRTAVKWDPDNLETRMMLVESLLDDGRFWGAENELARILEKEPNHIPALLKMGEVLFESGNPWEAQRAEGYWSRALQLEPHNELVQQALRDYYLNQATDLALWGRIPDAISLGEKALALRPQDPQILALLGGFNLKLRQEEKGQAYLKQALEQSGADQDLQGLICEIQLTEGSETQFWRMVQEIETAQKELSYLFYINLTHRLLVAGKPAVMSKLLERAIAIAPAGTPVHLVIGEMLSTTSAYAQAQPYLEHALSVGEPAGPAYLALMMLTLRQGKTADARRYWREADKIARREKDPALLERVRRGRELLDVPPMFLNMVLGLPFLGDSPLLPPGFDFGDDFF